MATDDDVRQVALSLPETTEASWYGTPAYKVGGKGFLRFVPVDEETALLVFLADASEKELLHRAPPKVLRLHGDDVVRSTGK